MEDKELIGTISKQSNQYYLTTDDGEKYQIYAINPWESVPVDFDTGKFAGFEGKKVRVAGRVKGMEIWNALIHYLDDRDTKPPSMEDLFVDE
jgi:hypothetical protein